MSHCRIGLDNFKASPEPIYLSLLFVGTWYLNRFALGAWILYSLITLAGYSGNLKSHLTNAGTYPSLKTLSEVVDSDLRIDFIDYGGLEEEILASSTDPIIQALWKKVTLVPYDPVTNEMLVSVV